MLSKSTCINTVSTVLISLLLSACFHPPYNNFQNDHRALKKVGVDAGVGAGVGAVVGSVAAANPLAGVVVGGVAGTALAMYGSTERSLIKEMAKQDIEYIIYGDTRELIIPTDKYFEFNSHRLREQCYKGLNNIARLLQFYECNPIYVAGFTDAIGSTLQKQKLSQSRADAIVTFLWAKGIRAQRLLAEGHGDKHSVGDNHLIHGSAFNRRIEIQWINKVICPQEPAMESIGSK